MSDERRILLAHGNGGRLMRELIEEVFARHLAGPLLDTRADAATLPWQAPDMVFTTDGFTVQPLEFPGGDIGSLAVHGTVNDLAVSGATPVFLALNAFIEEGFELARLERIVASLARAAREAGVQVVAGDTKVLPRGECGGLYLATTGVGRLARERRLGVDRVSPGDRIVLSGPVGDHGISVLLARGDFGLEGELLSDAASVLPFTQALLELPGLRFMRDPTRGEAYRWIVWQDTTLRPKLLPLNHSWIIVENPKYRHLDELEEKRKAMLPTWTILERHLAGRDFIAGKDFSMGDIPMGIMAYWWYRMPIDHFDLPNIEAWYARISDRGAFQRQVLR